MLTNTGAEINPDFFASDPELIDPDFDGEWVIRAGQSSELPARYLAHGIGNESRYIKPPRMPEIPEKYLCYEKAEDLADTIEMQLGSRHFCLINGSFIFGDFIEALLVKKLWQVKKMTISTLSMSENNVDSLANLIEGGFILELNLIVSDYFFSHEQFRLIPYLYEKLDIEDRFQLAVAGTHCKLCSFETTCGKKIVIHGSANLRSSGNIEQFMVEWNDELHNFNQTIQDRIIDRYKTINKTPLSTIRGNECPPSQLKQIKPLRHSKLWQAAAQDTNP